MSTPSLQDGAHLDVSMKGSIREMFCRCQWTRKVKHSSFTPLFLSATGGLLHEATAFNKHLASVLSSKWGYSYSVTLGWLHCCLSFSQLHSPVSVVFGCRLVRVSSLVAKGGISFNGLLKFCLFVLIMVESQIIEKDFFSKNP